ncbi:MAG: right-handed parallel beta-helix repeat-containing protein [Bacteroidales bacterium]|nr:right-handed parallel beta-helix repeat-containing protein [Bacteroidales bacterium]
MKTIEVILITLLVIFSLQIEAKEYHVSVDGDDNAKGSLKEPFRTISVAANIAQSGDTITIHEGVYRERVNPLNGGFNDLNRIVYQAAQEEKVIIKGSEIISDWKKVEGSVWKAVIPNTLFKDYNPYSDFLTGDWLNKKGVDHHTGEVFLNGKSLFEKSHLKDVIESKPYPDARDKQASTYTWYSEVDKHNTTIWANFQKFDPNKELVEINVRESCFYPDKPGINYITVRGFIMDQAATQWAAPTAEQIGLIGTHWSKGWIIENNVISNSKSVGITLGKDRSTGQNVWMNNPVKDGATHYNEVIFRALEIGWSKEKIGSHIVRNNVIFDCGQAGIVGSLGGVYSKIYNNHIYDIWTKRIFSGAEMAGIKIHASIDMLINSNRIHNTGRGIWIDWMAQGTRISGNLLYDNTTDDLFAEVNHGPYLVDNNIFLSELSLRDWSEGGAFVHNIFAGKIEIRKVFNRFTPYHLAHSTKVSGLRNIHLGDNRFFNNIFVKQENGTEKIEVAMAQFYGLHGYRIAGYKIISDGNIFYNGAKPYNNETNSIETPKRNPSFEIEEKGRKAYLKMEVDNSIFEVNTSIVTTEKLGSTVVSEAIYENPDGSSYTLEIDFQGNIRNNKNPLPGPIEKIEKGSGIHEVW